MRTIDPQQLREAVDEPFVRGLQVLQSALVVGPVLFAGFVVVRAVVMAPAGDPGETDSFLQILTAANLAWMVIAYVAGGLLFRKQLGAAGSAGDARARTEALRGGWILRLALAEGSALFGAAVCFLATDRAAAPVYWVNLLPVAAMLVFGTTTFPTRDRLLEILQGRP